MSRIRLIIADDHPAFLEGICTLVAMRYPELEVVATGSNGQEAVERTKELNPDLVVLDIRMPVMDGVEAAGLIRRQCPRVKTVMLTTFNEKNLVSNALRAGAMGYILKETPVNDLIDNIKRIYRGNVLISQSAAGALSGPEEEAPADAEERKNRLRLQSRLPEELRCFTPRELDVLDLLIQNYSNRGISEALCISPGTTRNYVSRVYSSLGVTNRSGLFFWALDHEL